MMKQKRFLVLMVFALACWACHNKQEAPQDYQAPVSSMPDNAIDSTAFMVADSILYDVVVRNPDPADEWTGFQLRKVDERKLIDLIFEGVYAGKLKAYEYTSEAPMTIEDVKALDGTAGCERERFAKMQFEERWFIDSKSLAFVKKVTAIMLAYEIKGKEGRYKAGILVKLPQDEPL